MRVPTLPAASSLAFSAAVILLTAAAAVPDAAARAESSDPSETHRSLAVEAPTVTAVEIPETTETVSPEEEHAMALPVVTSTFDLEPSDPEVQQTLSVTSTSLDVQEPQPQPQPASMCVCLCVCPFTGGDHFYEGTCDADAVGCVCDDTGLAAQRECPPVYDDVCPPTMDDAMSGFCADDSTLNCNYGTETCCGEDFVSLSCGCWGNHFGCFHTEACMFPQMRCPEQYTHECPCPYPDAATGEIVTYSLTLDIVGVWEPVCPFEPPEGYGEECPDKPPLVSPPLVIECLDDSMPCPDGSTVGRDIDNDCNFFPCPPVACTRDAFLCPDGSTVGRDPLNDCEFFPCPLPDCTDDVYTCLDGSTRSRDPANDCNFFPCWIKCDCDGDGHNDMETTEDIGCEIACGPPTHAGGCDQDVMECPDGTVVGRDEAVGCEFLPCPDINLVMCTMDAKECWDGSFVGRDPTSDPPCEWYPCPTGGPANTDTVTGPTEPPLDEGDKKGPREWKGKPPKEGNDKPGQGPKTKTAPTGGPATTLFTLPATVSCSNAPKEKGAYALCDKYCNEDKCPEVLLAQASTDNDRQRRGLLRRGLKPKAKPKPGSGEPEADKLVEHCIGLERMYGEATGGNVPDCA